MKHFLAAFVVLFAFAMGPAWAQRVEQLPGMSHSAAMSKDRIAAVVNDNIITTSDIEARMKLAFLSSGLPDTVEVREHILPQILRGLIDEQLELQEAKRLDITIPKDEIDKALQTIAQDNHINGDMRVFIQSKGGSAEALEQQVRAGLAWNKVIQRELRPRVDVGDDEVDAAIARIRANNGKQEFLVSEIYLPVDNPKDEDQIKQVADNLVQQIKGGANFAAVARQFSQSTGAASGGDIGWIQEGQLPADLNSVLTRGQTGQIAGPIRSANGYHILALREKRTISLDGTGSKETVLDLQQAFRPVQPHADKAQAMQEAQKLHTVEGECATLPSRMAAKFPTWHLQSTDGMKLSQAPGWLADKVRDLPAGKASDPINTDKGILVLFMCNRSATPSEGKIDRDAIMSSIGNEKLELQGRRLQRDLRRGAYLDIRLGKS